MASDLVNEIQRGTRAVMELIGRFRYVRNKFFLLVGQAHEVVFLYFLKIKTAVAKQFFVDIRE